MYDDTAACIRELATLFAHISYESGTYNEQSDKIEFNTEGYDVACAYFDHDHDTCHYDNDVATELGKLYNMPLSDEDSHTGRVFFYGRGPIYLKWHGYYALFSKAYFPDVYDGA